MKLTRLINIFYVAIFLPLFSITAEENLILNPQEKFDVNETQVPLNSSLHFKNRKNFLIQLNDDSIWSIRPEDWNNIINSWKKNHTLLIKPVKSFWPDFMITFNYTLCNLNEGTEAAIRLKLTGRKTPSIEIIDTDAKVIFLNNKTTWQIHPRADISKWTIGHHIVIGVANDWDTNPYPQILINTDLNNQPHVSSFSLEPVQ